MKINKICHLADIHIRKTPTRNNEYEEVFKNLIKSLKQKKPDRIVIVGDLVNDYLDLQGEQLIMANKLLYDLSKIAPVRITRGNHDCRKKNLNRVDSVKAIVETLNNPNVIYYNETGFYQDENVVWAVWHHGEKNNNPWKSKEGKKIKFDETPDLTYIDLFHDPINGCKMDSGVEVKSKSYYKISDFKGDFSMLGDIHLKQYLGKNKTKAYCSSLIAQNFAEGDDNFHGYLLWDIENKTAEEIAIKSSYSYKNIKITPYVDFDDLDIEIDNPTKHMKVRFVWMTLPQTRNNINERKIVEYIKSKYNNITISHKNEFIEEDEINVDESITIENISDKTVQQTIFREYLENIGTDEKLINDVLALDEEISDLITLDETNNIEWSIIKFGGVNFMSYNKLDIDWRDMDGLFQITGINTAGKTTIMKLITYILYNKTLETETRMKHGDKRYVNNRNNAKETNTYLVLDGNGEYYGIKRKTVLEFNKNGEIKNAPTTVSYYVLATPDDEMTDDNALEKLDEDKRIQTQKRINRIIGTYDNFMRIVMTTSDTLNRILSNDMAVFIDSILYDTGLDVFDKKLDGYKQHQKKINELSRVTCNVALTEEKNNRIQTEINEINNETNNIRDVIIPNLNNSIKKGNDYVESLIKKMFKIDDDIYNLDIDQTKTDIETHNREITRLTERKLKIQQDINKLKETYDEKRFNELTEKKNNHKTEENQLKSKIKTNNSLIEVEKHRIEIINGEIFKLKKDGVKIKNEIIELKESKTCPTCGQLMTEDHREHIDAIIKRKEVEMYGIGNKINEKKEEITPINKIINNLKTENKNTEKTINANALEQVNVLTELGELTNDRNDVETRSGLVLEMEQIPTKIQNEELKCNILQNKINNYDNSLKQIEENKEIEKTINLSKLKVKNLNTELTENNNKIINNNNNVNLKEKEINENNKLIKEFKEQEYRDIVLSTYKKCVHRDGIPRQILTNNILPKINKMLGDILSISTFKIWLDSSDLRPKLVYNDRPHSIIDCISASGKERTFSSVVLKFALNQINIKSKPTIFLLDEVMGKLDDDSLLEFIEIMQLIKEKTKKILIVEHHANLNPDYLIDVQLDDDGVSYLKLE